MRFDEQTQAYLRGKEFSSGGRIRIESRVPVPTRVSLLRELVRGRTVLHLGSLDHLPLIEAKLKRHEWLHKELTVASRRCLGVDIDADALEYVKQEYGFDNIIDVDLLGPVDQRIASHHWDYAILGELLEHVDDPVGFLRDIIQKYSSCIGKLVITVPNALNVETFRFAKRSLEVINTDHRYWFTPYTIAKVVTRAGAAIDEVLFANRVTAFGLGALWDAILVRAQAEPRYPFTRAMTLVAITKELNETIRDS